ncbi:MAG: PDGLE domain-containing protein [Mycolicibacterium sp.]|uniref:PDGLE domain-containing protein n=1 Tax=Mycolicibacterium sp. TaxID=2320850 RepID=UPI003D14F5E3
MSRRWFWVGFAVAIVLVAGVLSYFASSSPDGLDSTTLRGCEVIETEGGEQLTGDCIAKHAKEHRLADSPLADYQIEGHERTGGLAGIIGVLVTVAISAGGFWLIARTRSGCAEGSGAAESGRR